MCFVCVFVCLILFFLCFFCVHPHIPPPPHTHTDPCLVPMLLSWLLQHRTSLLHMSDMHAQLLLCLTEAALTSKPPGGTSAAVSKAHARAWEHAIAAAAQMLKQGGSSWGGHAGSATPGCVRCCCGWWWCGWRCCGSCVVCGWFFVVDIAVLLLCKICWHTHHVGMLVFSTTIHPLRTIHPPTPSPFTPFHTQNKHVP